MSDDKRSRAQKLRKVSQLDCRTSKRRARVSHAYWFMTGLSPGDGQLRPLRQAKNTTCFQNHGSVCTLPKRRAVVFENSEKKKNHSHVLCLRYNGSLLGQLASLSKEACSYADADWLSSSVTESEGGERSVVYIF